MKYKIYKLNILILFFSATCICSCKKETTIIHKAKPEVIINAGDARLLSGELHFVKDTVYVLATNLIRNTGQTLIVDAGTLIKINDNQSIVINAGGRIEANGNQSEPIVFTSATLKGAPGLLVNNSAGGQSFWYGITISGTPGQSSGNMSFTRVEFAGGYHGSPTDASLSLINVDSTTTLNNIQVSYSFATPSFEFSGGNCNAKHLISYASSGTDFNIEDGYTGMMQHLLAYRHPYFAPPDGSGTSLAGLLISSSTSFPVISNLTVIGPDTIQGTSLKYADTTSPGPFGSTNGSRVAAFLVRGGKFHIRNTILAGFPKAGFYMDETNSALSLQSNESEFSYSIVESNDRNRAFFLPLTIYPPYTSQDFRDFILLPQYNNQLFYNIGSFDFSDPYNYDFNPNPLPNPSSVILNGSNFDGPVFSNPFFDHVSWRGATGIDSWMKQWVNFIPLQTDYNN